jgi:unsaturated chondroitin disaccharide hydrolase
LSKEVALSTRYRVAAKNILASLCASPYLSRGTSSMGILNHAVGSRPGNSEVDVSLIYGDYYFLEALCRYKNLVGNK